MSFDFENKSLQIFSLWMVDADGMIGRLVELMQYAHMSATLCCSSEHG